MNAFLQLVELSAPLFALVLVGYLIGVSGRWPVSYSEALSKFLFAVPLPALLFRLMSDLSKLPPVDARVLVAFFGGSFAVFLLARVAGLLFQSSAPIARVQYPQPMSTSPMTLKAFADDGTPLHCPRK